jgi:pimeloyl-ACP methyl ester carboxylesterase
MNEITLNHQDNSGKINGAKQIALFDALIYCEFSGDNEAPALVLLHGNGEDLHIFDTQIRFFSRYFRTIAIDTRGHGKSTRGSKPLSFQTFANDLADVFEALEINKAHIIGFSDGAITALHLALTHPELISSMVLLGANYHTKGLRLIPRLQIQFVYACLAAASLFSEKIRKRKEIWGLMVNQPHLTLEELSRIQLPTLIVTGEKDMVSQHHNDEMHRAIAGSQRLIIPNGNHYWMFKQTESFHQCVMDFLPNTNR